jgi:hypothetical protein
MSKPKKPTALISRVEVPTTSHVNLKQGRRTFEYRLDDLQTKERLATTYIVALPGDDYQDRKASEDDVMYASLYHIAIGMGYRVVDNLSGELAAATRKSLQRAAKHNEESREKQELFDQEFRLWRDSPKVKEQTAALLAEGWNS